MPAFLFINSWRFRFYSNEQGEPMPIHAEKSEAECKYWIEADAFNIREAFAYNLTPRDVRQVRQIIFENFDYLVSEWQRVLGQS